MSVSVQLPSASSLTAAQVASTLQVVLNASSDDGTRAGGTAGVATTVHVFQKWLLTVALGEGTSAEAAIASVLAACELLGARNCTVRIAGTERRALRQKLAVRHTHLSADATSQARTQSRALQLDLGSLISAASQPPPPPPPPLSPPPMAADAAALALLVERELTGGDMLSKPLNLSGSASIITSSTLAGVEATLSVSGAGGAQAERPVEAAVYIVA